jgi:hypothetical protein
MDGAEGSRARAGHQLEGDDDPDTRAQRVSGGGGYRFGIWRYWAVGCFSGRAKSDPAAFFLFFYFFFPFLFLFSDLVQSLFANFIQTNSNEVLNLF